MHRSPTELIHPVEEAPEAKSRQEYPEGREHDPWPQHGAYLRKLSLKATEEEDDRQCYHP